ncbi:MAG: hypothetical protein CSA32_03720 [Desulfobulbus propionicus]|nr:MAG: hypothetical protein CSA32_03720 [Desulfobulbus propionicus]
MSILAAASSPGNTSAGSLLVRNIIFARHTKSGCQLGSDTLCLDRAKRDRVETFLLVRLFKLCLF